MSVEYDYYNKITTKHIELGKDFCIGSNAWSDIFHDFKELNECYSVNELFLLIKKPLIEHENFSQKHDANYKLDWLFWDKYITECAGHLHSFLTSDIPDNFYMNSDNGIFIGNQSYVIDDNELSTVYKNLRNKENRIWSRYKDKTNNLTNGVTDKPEVCG